MIFFNSNAMNYFSSYYNEIKYYLLIKKYYFDGYKFNKVMDNLGIMKQIDKKLGNNYKKLNN